MKKITDSKETKKVKSDFEIIDKPQKKHKKVAKILTVLLIIAVTLPLLVSGFSLLAYKIWSKDIKFDKSLLPTASAVPTFYDLNGVQIDYKADNFVPPEDIPINIKNAFVALEDKRFYSHKGYDLVRIGGAMLSNLKSHKVKEGASTITQQLVKNTHLTNERTLKRKIMEIAIAEKMEKEYSKDEILSMYLSVIYFGKGAYGINSACKLYFDKEPANLTLSECATLAGVVKNPSKYSPLASIEQATKRRNLVLDVMRNEALITEKECEEAKSEEIKVVENKQNGSVNNFYLARVIEEVQGILNITNNQLNNSGYKVFTAMSQDIQKQLAHEAKNRSNFESDDIDSVAIVLDNKSGGVLAHYSSLPYDITRQAGSTMKPLAVYAPALEKNLISLASPIVDEKVQFSEFSPDNFDNLYFGMTTPREAIKKSMNSVAVKVMSYLGAENSANFVRSMGISLSPTDDSYALALGATARGIQPLQLASAYSIFARGGEKIKQHYVVSIVDKGEKIAVASHANSAERVISRDTSFLITSALCDTVKSGTSRGLSYLPFEIAAKTGTVQKKNSKNTDAWNVGYTTENTVLVWHGAKSMSEQGGGRPTIHAGKIWKSLYQSSSLPSNFAVPDTIHEVELDTYSTDKNKLLTLAHKNTPKEFRQTEIFSLSNLPTCDKCYFNVIDAPKFQLTAHGKGVEIGISEIEKIYKYEVIRIDDFGQRKIAEINGSEISSQTDEIYRIYDNPFSLGAAVEYKVICKLGTNFEADPETLPSASSSQKIFVDLQSLADKLRVFNRFTKNANILKNSI